MGKALNAADTASRDLSQNAKPGQLADGRFTDNALRNPPSLQALKLQDMLMKNAGGKIAEDAWHSFPLATFKQVKGFRNLSHEDVVRLFEELRAVTMRHVNYEEGHTAVYGMISVGRVDMDEGNGKLSYKFDEEFRKLAESSDLYAVIDYRAGLAMKSRYAHRLHEIITFKAGREKNVQRFTVEDLRARLAAPSASHFFGTDEVGRDLYSRILYGGRQSVAVGFFVVLVAGFIGTFVGAFAGLIGGRVDVVIMRLMDVVLSVPSLYLNLNTKSYAVGPPDTPKSPENVCVLLLPGTKLTGKSTSVLV